MPRKPEPRHAVWLVEWLDASDAFNLQRTSFLATIRQLSAVEYAAAGRAALPLVLDEVL